jgi:hypothetical protein
VLQCRKGRHARHDAWPSVQLLLLLLLLLQRMLCEA